VCLKLGVPKEKIREKGRRNMISYAKGLLAYWGQEEIGMKGSDIARYLRMSKTSVTKAYRRGEKYAAVNKLKLTSLL
ncbi:hypothetical protein KAR34_05560, partial [bacterium]|nr:hypothetical protein [bacterium]